MATSKINADYLFKTYTLNLPSYAAGTAVGYRLGYVDKTDIGIVGYIPVSAVADIHAGTLIHIQLCLGVVGGNDTLRCLIYRAHPNAIAASELSVRVMYIKSGT